MREIHNVLLIKNAPHNELEKGLLSYKKEQLFQIAEKHQLPVRKSYTKAKMVEQLKPVIMEKAADFFKQLDSSEAELVSELTNGPLAGISNETLFHVQSSIGSGYVFAYVANNEVTLVLPNELVSSIESEMSQTLINVKLKKSSLFLRQMKNAQKIYGTYHIQHLVSVWNNYFTQNLTVEEATKMFETAQ